MAKKRKTPKRRPAFKRFESSHLDPSAVCDVIESPIGDWVIWYRMSRGNWHTFTLEAPRLYVQKSAFHGAWNGSRIAMSRDMQILLEYEPEMFSKLRSKLEMVDWENRLGDWGKR